MKPIYKLVLIAFLLPTLVFANDNKKKHERSKTIKKEYNVNADATLDVSNKYGNLEITTWNKNSISIEVKVTVKGNDLDDVDEKLRAIDVAFNASNSLVQARTIVGSKKSSWSWWGKNNNISYQINYYIKMPVTNQIDLNNKYGNIYLDELEGSANIECDYGKISIEKLSNKDNVIDLDYCSRSKIGYMKSGDVSIDYSKLEISNSEKLSVNADYSNLDIGKTENIKFNTDYGSISIDEAININGNSDYAGMQIGTVKKNLIIDTDYGGLRVKNLAKGFENVTIDGSYAGIKIGTPSNNNFDFKLNLGFAGFSYSKENVEMFKSIKKTTKKYYEGTWGKANSNSKINIKSSYGSVSIKQND